MGLCNRVVAEGTSRAAAEALARELARLPQRCLKADRISVYRQWDLRLERALVAEARGGLAATTSEAVAGAARFASVLGRHGAFDEIQRCRSGLGLCGIG